MSRLLYSGVSFAVGNAVGDALIRIPEERARFARPDAGPVGHRLPRQRLAALRLLLQVIV